MQSVPIASKVLRSIPARGEVCSIQTSTTLRCTRYNVRQGWGVYDTNFYNVEVYSIQSSPGVRCARYKLLQRWGVLDTKFARGEVCSIQENYFLHIDLPLEWEDFFNFQIYDCVVNCPLHCISMDEDFWESYSYKPIQLCIVMTYSFTCMITGESFYSGKLKNWYMCLFWIEVKCKNESPITA